MMLKGSSKGEKNPYKTKENRRDNAYTNTAVGMTLYQ